MAEPGDKDKPLTLDEIMNLPQPHKPQFSRTIPVPVSVGTGIGKEIKDMFKPGSGKYQEDGDD